MHSFFRAMPRILLALWALLTLSFSACAGKTEERLESLEASARDQSIIDLRLTHLEQRVTHVESAIGELREGAASSSSASFGQSRARRGKPSTERLAAAPVTLGTVPAGDLPVVQSVPYLPSTDPLGANPMPPPAVGVGVAPVNDPFAGPGLTTVPLVSGQASRSGLKPDGDTRQGARAVLPAPSTSKPTSSSRSSGTGAAAYDAAYALYEKGEYAKAQQAFADFLSASPKSPLAPNAIYWQGECRYSLGQYDGAIIFFQDVINKYPKHAKAAAALLKAGYSYERLKDMDNARFYWQILVDDFPKSAPAALARKRLAG